MRVVVVGAGTAAPHPREVCSAYWVEHAGVRLLLDCGPGAVHGLARHALPWPTVTHLAISHFHTDHIGDVAFLLFALRHGTLPARSEKLVVVGPVGIRDHFRALAAAFGSYVEEPGFELVFEEIASGDPLTLGDGVTLSAFKTPHTPESLAYRIDARAQGIVYTGDTGADANLGTWARGADILIAECSLPDESAIDTHLTPTRIAQLARSAQPRVLLVTHVYPQLQGADLPELIRNAGWSGPVLLAAGGLQLP